MRSVIPLAIKDLKLLLRDRMGMFFVIVFPVIMGLFFGVINKSFVTESPRDVAVGLVDHDQSDMSRRFAQRLVDDGGIKLSDVTPEEATLKVRARSLLAYLVIPKGFGETAGIMWTDPPRIDIGIDPSRRAEAALLQGRVMQCMGRMVQDRFADPGSMREHVRRTAEATRNDPGIPPGTRMAMGAFYVALDSFLGTMAETINEQDGAQDDVHDGAGAPKIQLADVHVQAVQTEPTKWGKLQSRIRSSWDISFPSAMMWGIFGCVAGFATSMVRERTEGTLLRLNVAPIARWHILSGKGLACFVTSSGVVIVMLLLGLTLGLRIGNVGHLVLAVVCLSLSMVGLMMLMSVLGRTEQAVGGAGWAIIVVASMFGGGMIPLTFMPEWMVPLSNISPAKWAILSLEGAIWRGFTLSQMLIPCGVMLAIGAACFAVGLNLLSRQRD